MRQDDVERMLASEGWIEPSAGFTAAVMEAVRREAAAPAPLAFPWRRALPGLVLAAAGTVAGLGVLVGALVTAPAAGAAPDTLAVLPWLAAGHAWTAAALGGTLLLAWLAVRLSRESAEPLL